MVDYWDDIVETGSINLVKGWESGERPVTDSIRCQFSNYVWSSERFAYDGYVPWKGKFTFWEHPKTPKITWYKHLRF